jgi:CRP/FNR family transcriptional regulator, dissimilatory nitrate respiration regulator
MGRAYSIVPSIALITVKPTFDLITMQSAGMDLQSLRQTALIAALRRSRIFADLSLEDLQDVASACTTRSLEKGEVLFREGEKAEGFYVMQTGAINIYRLTPDGREQIICVFRPPESFAEVTLATTETYPANAVALESSQVIRVQKARFRELVCRKPELALHMLASMSLHLKHLVQSLQDIKGRQVEGRLADWILKHSPAAAAGCPSVFTLPITKRVLAGQLSVTSETLSRTLARFKKEGLITVDGPQVRVLNGPGLRAYFEA